MCLHGNFLTNTHHGLLILGSSGFGKSSFSYYLSNRHNFYLVSDDLTVFKKTVNGLICGYLFNNMYLGKIYLKNTGIVQVNHALPCFKLTHIIRLTDNEKITYITILDTVINVKNIDIRNITWNNCYKIVYQHLNNG